MMYLSPRPSLLASHLRYSFEGFLFSVILLLGVILSTKAEAQTNGPTVLQSFTNTPISTTVSNALSLDLTQYFSITNLPDYFNTPTTLSNTVVVNSSMGDFLIQLFPTNAPATVANFLDYVTNGDYENMIIHRSVPGFVIQTGGYSNNTSLSAIPTFPPVTGEPGLSNLTGTVAMALSSGPNSATDQWFINLADNSSALDNASDGGPFTVFGQVIGNGISVAQAIAALPTNDFSGYYGSAFRTVPLQGWTNGTVNLDNLVTITNIFPLQGTFPYFAVSSDSNAFAVAVNGTNLTVSFVAYPTNPSTIGNLAKITVFAVDTNDLITNSSFQVYPSVAGSQTITFPAIPEQTYTTNQFLIGNYWPTSSSGVSVDITSYTGPLRVNSNGIPFFSGTGTVTLTANTETNANINLNYTPAHPVTISFRVTPNPITGSFSVPEKSVTNIGTSTGTFALEPPSSRSTGAFTYTSSNTNVAVVSNNIVTLTGIGTTTITVTQAAAGNYGTTYITKILTVAGEKPKFGTFSIPSQTYGSATLTLNAPASTSSGAFTYTSSDTNVASVSGNTVTIAGKGTAIITATQAAAGRYASASINTSLKVLPAVPTVSFTPPTSPTSYILNEIIPLTTTSTSGGAITYHSSKTGVISVSGSRATIKGAGTATLTATVAAHGNYTASTASNSVTVTPAIPILGTWSIPSKSLGAARFNLIHPASPSSGAFTYTSSATNVASVSGNTVTIKAAGSTTITATQAANGNYGTNATSAIFTVSPAL
jgi:cyclophilin family peptidyl-prolyl cis-trans isomerase